MPVTVQCGYCGKAKQIPPSQYKNSKNGVFYCGYACHNLGRQNRVQLVCKQCQESFERPASNVGEFCSHSCAHEWHWNHAPEAAQRKQEAVSRMEATSLSPGKEVIYRLHVEDGLSVREIGEMYGMKAATIRKWIHKHGIPFTSYPIKVIPWNKKEMPPEQELRLLYETQKMTMEDIAERLGVSVSTVGDWLRLYSIKARPAGVGLVARGIAPPTPDELHQMIHVERLTYEQVAARYGADFTAVPYWLDKHGISRPKTWLETHSDPETVAQMRAAYETGMSLDEVGKMFGGITQIMIKRVFRENSVPIRKDGWNGGKRFDCIDGHKVRSTYEQRVDNWLHEHGVDHTYEPSLPFSPSHKADFSANGWYIEVWGVTNNAKYKERKQRKIELYQKYHAHLIEIPYYAFAKHSNGLWLRRLEQCLTPASPEDVVQHGFEFG